MNGAIGWALAAAAVAAGWVGWGWHGVLLAVTGIVFWLLLQFSRALRVMRGAAQRPVGRVPSAVMLHARLRPGMTMLQVVALTRSLGERSSVAEGEGDERWRWHDAGGVAVEVGFGRGRVLNFRLHRPGAPDAGP